jgi:predicted DCC family thiol-disulfide oxidoreductase YuxK
VSRRIIGVWRRYWFTPASLTDLGVSRIVLVAIILYLNGTSRYLRVATVDPAFWSPVALLQLLGIGQPSVAAIQWLTWGANALLVAAGLGLATRPALLAAFPLLLVLEAMGNSVGKVTHAGIPVIYAVLFFGLAPSGRGFSVESMWHRARAAGRAGLWSPRSSRMSAMARWPLDLLFVELAAFYFFAGVSKLRDAGPAWMDGYTLQYHLLFKGTAPGAWLAGHLGLCAFLSVLVMVFELGAPLGMVRRLRPAVLGGGLFFHLGTTYFLGISFWPVAALYALFVPWSRLGRALAHSTGVVRRRLDVFYDGGCARCRGLVSLVSDLDLADTARFVDIAAGTTNYQTGRRPTACTGIHVVDSRGTTAAGFDAFRRLAWTLPAAWPTLPLLYVPGAAGLGRQLYAPNSTGHRAPLRDPPGIQ